MRGLLWVPYHAVPDLDQLKRKLTFQPRPKMGGEQRPPVAMYWDIPDKQVIGLPWAWVCHTWGQYLDIVDRTTLGEAMNPGSQFTPPDPNHEAVRDPEAQAKFIADMERAVTDRHRFTAQAPTGSGKTVVGAWMACTFRRKTLILTHLQRLNVQWTNTFHHLLNMPLDRIGQVGGGQDNWRDKDVVVGTVQTVAELQRFPKEFYESFGMVIYDELHKFGAPYFQQAVWQFPATYQFGMSATVGRKDGADIIFRNYLGDVCVTSQQTALPLQVWPVWIQGGKRWGRDHGARVKCITQDFKRNQRIARLVLKMYQGGRNAIIVSEHVKHLEDLMQLCEQLGIPKVKMGQFTSEVRETKKVQAGDRYQEVTRKRKQSQATLNKILEHSQLIFATYGMIKEGVDCPRLDGGIDVTPQSGGTQLIGRLRRPHPGKKEPVIWITLVDANCDRSLRYYQQRLVEYQQAGAEVMSR